jgi:hypothetical protein
VNWFNSTFAASDRTVIGTADFPSMPWVSSGTLSIEQGRLSGNGAVRASQGLVFPYAGLRLRFKGSFTDSAQHVVVGLNAMPNGSSGLRVDVDGAGAVTVTENGVSRGETSFGAFGVGELWFAELELANTEANLRLSRGNYASAGGSSVIVSLRAPGLARTTTGKHLALALTSTGGLSPTVDEVSVARCGIAAPSYRAIFRDAFDRADSNVLGNADLPPTSAWTATTSDVAILNRALVFVDEGGWASASQGAFVRNDGVRYRYAFYVPVNPLNFLNLVGYNYSGTGPGGSFGIAWRDASSTYLAVGNAQDEYPFSPVVGGTYYVQIDADGADGVLTVRTGSYTGPVVAVHFGTGLSFMAGNQRVFMATNKSLQIQEIELAQYAAP